MDDLERDLEILKADREELLEQQWMLGTETFRMDLIDLEETILYLEEHITSELMNE